MMNIKIVKASSLIVFLLAIVSLLFYAFAATPLWMPIGDGNSEQLRGMTLFMIHFIGITQYPFVFALMSDKFSI